MHSDDQKLQTLVLEAKTLPFHSSRRQILLNRILSSILRSNRLTRPQQGYWHPNLYEDFWNQAISQTLLEICQKIDQYNPAYPVLAWVNARLIYRFQDTVRDYYQAGITGIPRQGVDGKPVQVRSLDRLSHEKKIRSLENLNGSKSSDNILDGIATDAALMRDFIKIDPEQRLRKHLRSREEVTFQRILLYRLDDLTWKEIVTILGSPILSEQTLCSFFNRQMRNEIEYLQRYLQY